MSKLIISGKKSYTKRMYKHLRKEHPSTRQRMILRDRLPESKFEHMIILPSTINYCELCGKTTKKVKVDKKSTNVCNTCMKGQLSGIKTKTKTRSIEDEWSI